MERNSNRARKYTEAHIIVRVKHLVDDIKKRILVGMFRNV
jgi:hypothetical protein